MIHETDRLMSHYINGITVTILVKMEALNEFNHNVENAYHRALPCCIE